MPVSDLGLALSTFAFTFTLILCRSGAAIMLLPAFGEDELPAMLRVGLAVGFAVLLTPVVASQVPAPPAEFLRLAGMISAELLAGGVIGWLARLVVLALPIAGQIISLMTGLSSILQPDATLGAQSAAIGKLLNLLAPVLILATGLYALPLSAIANSYRVFPAGMLLPSGDLIEVAVRAVGGSFALALRLAAPFLLVGTLWQISLGVLSRLVPQIQIYLTSLPGQVLGGLLLLGLLGSAMIRAWIDAVRDGFSVLPGS